MLTVLPPWEYRVTGKGGTLLKKLFCIIGCVVCLCAFSPGRAQAETERIVVSASLSLKNAFEEIGKLFESKHNVKVLFTFGESGDLLRQLEGGAPVDVFASDSEKDMDAADKKGLIEPLTRRDFTKNDLVLIVPAWEKKVVKNFPGLAGGAIKKIAIGNPDTVPAGRYAEEIFEYYHISNAVKDKLFFVESERKVLEYVDHAEVDAGIIYFSDALLKTTLIKGCDVKTITVAPAASHEPVTYPIAAIKNTKASDLSKKFIAVVASDEGQTILQKYGFAASTGMVRRKNHHVQGLGL
jgi:molybdate transport system substrate-binding protein